MSVVGPVEQSFRDRAILARRRLSGHVPVQVIERLAIIAATPVKRRGPSPRPIEPPYLPSEAPATPARSSADIIKEVSLKHHVSVAEILSDIRSTWIVAARFEAMYRIREERHLSWAQIGLQFNRDHTSVIHGWRKYKKQLEGRA